MDRMRREAAEEAQEMTLAIPHFKARTQEEQNKAIWKVFQKVARTYHVDPEDVRDAVDELIDLQEEEEAEEKEEAAADEAAWQRKIDSKGYLRLYWRKWRPIPILLRVLITYGVICIFPPITMVVLPWLCYCFFQFAKQNPDHWGVQLVELAGSLILIAKIREEYKKFRDGPRRQ